MISYEERLASIFFNKLINSCTNPSYNLELALCLQIDIILLKTSSNYGVILAFHPLIMLIGDGEGDKWSNYVAMVNNDKTMWLCFWNYITMLTPWVHVIITYNVKVT